MTVEPMAGILSHSEFEDMSAEPIVGTRSASELNFLINQEPFQVTSFTQISIDPLDTF